MNCEEKRIQNNWTQKQFEECVQKNLPDLSEANEKAKEFKSEKGIVEKGIDKVKEAANIIDLGLKTIDKISESYSEADKLNNLKNIKISPETYADEDSDEYFNPEFLKSLGQNMSTNDPLKVSEEEDAIFSQLGLQLALDKNKDNPDYKPSTMDIWHESYRLKTLAAQDASGEDATILENLAGKNIVTNVISDIYRSVDKGYAQPENLETSLQIFEQGNETEDKILQKFLEDKKELIASNQDSDEAKAFQKCVEKNGDGFLSLGLCAIQNPGYIVQAGVESIALNAGAVTQSQTVRNNAFGGVVSGGAAGSVVPGIGTATGAMSGMFYGIGSTLEKGITFDELLIDATGIEDVSKITVEDLRKVLNDPEKLKDIQKKSERRGQVIGAVSALSGGAAAKTTTALVKAGKSAKVAAAAGGSVEMVGEGVGEYLGQKAAGQALSRQEIFLESFAGLGTKAPISVGGTLLNLNQLSTNLKVRNSVKANGFASMSDAFKPDVKTDQTQIDVSQIPNAEKTLNFELENKIRRKIITPEEAKNIQTSFRETKAVVNQIKPLGLSKTQQGLTVELLKEKKNLELTINQVNDESLTGKQSERVNEINEELKNVGEQETQKSVTKEAQGKKGQEIDNLAGQKNEDGNYEVTKAEWEGGKADEVITEIYNNDMLTGLIESKIPVEKPPGFSKPDFVSGVVAELIPHIRNFNPEVNNSLNGWIMSQINNKVGNVFKKGEAATKQVFETDVTEAKGVTDGTDVNVQIQEDLDISPRTAEQKASVTKLRDIAGITTEEAQVGVTETLKTRLPGVTEKKFRQKVNEANRLKFGEKVLAEMGGLKDAGRLVTFLDTNFNDIIAAIPNSVKNKQLASLFKPKQVGRAKTKVGEGVFEYTTPTKQELIDFYTTGKNTTNRARVKTLADVIAQELALDATAEVLADPKVQKEFIERQELQGKETPKDTIPKLLEAIDRQIADLQTQSDKYKNVLGLNNPKIVIDGLIIFAKTFKKVLKTTSNVKKAVEAAYKSLKKYLAGKVSTIEADIIIDEVKESVGEINKLDDATIDKIKEALTESLENYDKKQDQANFKAEAKKLKNELVNKALDNSKIYYAKTKNSPSRIDTKVADKLVVDAVKFAEAIPAEAHKALGIKGKPYTDIVGTHKRNFDIAGKKLTGPDKGKPGRYKNKFDNLNLKSADQLIADGTWSKKTAAIWNSIDMSKVQPLNSKATNLSPLLTKIKNILAGKTDAQTVAQKKAAIDKIYDPSVGLNNLKFAELNASILKDGYLNGSLSLDYVINALQAQTNVTAGFRAFTDIGGVEIKAGKIDLSTFKGEHLQSNSQTMSEILGWIVSPNSTSLELKNILSGHTQIFGDKTQLFDPIDTTFSKTSRLGAERLTRGLAKNIVESIYVPGTKTDFLTDTAQNEYKKQVQELGEAAKKASTVLNKGEQFVKNNPNSIPTVTDPVVLDKDINKMIEDTKGIKARYKFSDIVAKRRGAGLKSFKLIPASAQDFSGLMYDLYSKGKKGEQQQKWVQDNLIKPYQKGIAEIDNYRQALKNDYSSLLKKFPVVAKKLGKIAPDTEFTFDQALRVNLWTEGGFEIPGLSKRDIKKLNDIVNKDPELKLFNQAALEISKRDKWIEPSAYWDSESLISDLNNLTNKVGRKQYLASFIENADVIFSKENLNKMEVALGTNWREAMEDSLYRMKNGTNRPSGTNKLTNQFNNWVNNSVGAIMFMNVKSALLQTISSVNFLNWSDNNPYKAALAFGNQKQYWSDFATLWNSPKLKQRRSGLRKDVNEAELANAAIGAKNKPQAILSYLLKIGFTPTQMADSFAIASGGATFYRNRINTLKNQGLDQKAAEQQAFEDFAEASDVAQQSADPMLISQQQASPLGRLILAFQNTPAQVTRIFNKSARDFINNRGDQKTNVSKMIYYGAVQGMIFATLQNAAFALIPGFDNEEDEEKKSKEFDKKEERILNSMVDTMLRGSGVYGAIVSTLKNTALTYYREEKKDAFGKDHRNTLLEILNLSPPVGSKLRKINNAIKAKDYNEEVVKEQGWDVTLKGRVNLSPSYQVIASLTEAITNLPLERAVVEIDRIVEMLDARNTTFQRVALALGYRTWDVNTKNEERDLVKIESKEAKEKARKQKVIDDRAERKRLKELEKYKGKTKEEIKQMKRRDSIVDTNKSDQVKSLINLGLTKKEIKELKYEDDRVNKIIELTNK